MDRSLRKFNQQASTIDLRKLGSTLEPRHSEVDGLLDLVVPDLEQVDSSQPETSTAGEKEPSRKSQATQDSAKSLTDATGEHSPIARQPASLPIGFQYREFIPNPDELTTESRVAPSATGSSDAAWILDDLTGNSSASDRDERTADGETACAVNSKAEDTRELPSSLKSGARRDENAEGENIGTRSVAETAGRESAVPSQSATPREATAHLMRVTSTSFYEQNPQLIQRLRRRRENMGCPVLLFADVDRVERSADICVKVAFELAQVEGWNILVIDSDTESGFLMTQALGSRSKSGLTDCFRGDCQVEGALVPTENPRVRFLPSGKRPLNFRLAQRAIESTGQTFMGYLRREFDFVCVTCGTAFDNSLALWGQYCDATFVTLDPTHTSRSLAKAAVGELQRSGARVEGCIASFERERPTR